MPAINLTVCHGKAQTGSVLKSIPLLSRLKTVPKFNPIDWQTLDRIFVSSGFRFVRQEGSHRSYVKPGVSRPVVIPTYREVPVFVIRNNLKTAGISREEYFRLLEECR